jgi:hypothetical protein
LRAAVKRLASGWKRPTAASPAVAIAGAER